jgi:hypothetical protein
MCCNDISFFFKGANSLNLTKYITKHNGSVMLISNRVKIWMNTYGAKNFLVSSSIHIT